MSKLFINQSWMIYSLVYHTYKHNARLPLSSFRIEELSSPTVIIFYL